MITYMREINADKFSFILSLSRRDDVRNVTEK